VDDVSTFAPLAVVIPLLVAAVLLALNKHLSRTIAEAVAIVTATMVTVLAAGLLVRSLGGTIPYWFGGWKPSGGPPVGISFAVDPIGAGFATVIGIVTTAALVHSWRFHETVGNLLHVLLLVFMAGMVGFALTGDLFNLFVFFELMSVCAYALTGYEIEHQGPLQGALNLGITNAIAGSFTLIGIALVYARTGTLNMAAAGRALGGHPIDALVVVAFLMILAGLVTKGSIVPFHFWLADAHAVAPAPVCALFSGVMVELGLYGVARIYWTVFSGVMGSSGEVLRSALLVAGVVTVFVGSAMCLAQRHIKRLIAFSTVAHEGVFLIGIALLTPAALAGVATSVAVHALIKASLFLGTGVLLHRLGSVDEHELHGAGRGLPWTAAVFALGGLALAGLPPFATALGEGSIAEAAAERGIHWVEPVLMSASILTAGAILRAAGGIFGGWGERREPSGAPSPTIVRETEGPLRRTPPSMIVPAFVMLAGALLIGLMPAFVRGADRAASGFVDRSAYERVVIDDVPVPLPPPIPRPWWSSSRIAEATFTTLGAALVMLLGLFGRRLVGGAFERLVRPARAAIAGLRLVHNGHVGDYVAWMGIGVVMLGGTLLWGLR
jgi:multicomponent Na+:H+ antiporter subunit D